MLLGGGILAPSTGRGIEKFPSLRNSPCFARGRANRKEPNYFLFASFLPTNRSQSLVESIKALLASHLEEWRPPELGCAF